MSGRPADEGAAARESAPPILRRGRRRLARAALLAAAATALASFPFRSRWWGGLILAIAEAGVVGGLADWFAVTALFRRPLGLPIPHTALIPANWELMAARVGAMVGGRVLTTAYVTREISELDVAGVLARAAAGVTRADLESTARAVALWLATELPPAGAADLMAGLQRFLLARPASPWLADLLELARRRGWDERAIEALARTLGETLERPELRDALADLVDHIMESYRARMGTYPGLLIGLATMLGLIDRHRLVSALRAALRKTIDDPADPLRRRLTETLAALPGRLRADPVLQARVETVKARLLASPGLAGLVAEATAAIRRTLVTDLDRSDSELIARITRHLEHARQRVVSDEQLRQHLDHWVKAHASVFVARYQDRIAAFIERGVHALGPEGAVRLIEEHAGDDLQYIRVNGTVIGGLAGGAIYGLHLLLRRLL